VGGGPTGVEFSAELHDIIKEDLARLYPDLVKDYGITVYDVAPTVLSMFDKKLGEYAMKTLNREGVEFRTEHHIKSMRRGPPKAIAQNEDVKDEQTCFTMDIKEEGEVGTGMVVWSTGLMMNPFVDKALSRVQNLSDSQIKLDRSKIAADNLKWTVKKNPSNGSIITDDKLRLILEPEGDQQDKPRAIMDDVFAVGDCAIMEDTQYPATAQVASQKAEWLAKRLNKGDLESNTFHWKNMGVMAYIGNWNAILQSSGGNVSGRTAWFIWRGAYLTKAVSWRNRILIPMYWWGSPRSYSRDIWLTSYSGSSIGSLDGTFPGFRRGRDASQLQGFRRSSKTSEARCT